MLQFYNTLTSKKEPFHPIQPGKVGMYTCGPTVYNFAHIGNFRAYVFEDILRRYLKYRGFQVTQVMNITDVEDKIIRDSAAAGKDIDTFTAPYIQSFFEDLDSLNIERAEHYPRATEHIPEMIQVIQTLQQKGFTYESEGSIYFKISRFEEYGRLSGIESEQLLAGARVDSDEYEKEDVRDFVLWKANKGEQAKWDSPFGSGRPGWHIECTAMSMKYLGETFDIHTGGEDNIFPHHENEIAQSEAATGKRFVNYWLHCRYLLVNGEKMSKSKGNFYTLRDLLEQGHDPIDVRYALLAAQYRSPLDFSLTALEQAKASRRRLLDFRRRLQDMANSGKPATGQVPLLTEQAKQKFEAALDDDLDMPKALAALFEWVTAVHREADDEKVSAEDARLAGEFLNRAESVLGILKEKQQILPAEIEALIEERTQARKQRNFARADAIRDELLKQGILLEDKPDGTRWRWN